MSSANPVRLLKRECKQRNREMSPGINSTFLNIPRTKVYIVPYAWDPSKEFVQISHLGLTDLWGKYSYPHFIGGETKTQKGEVTCQGHNYQWRSQDLTQPYSNACAFKPLLYCPIQQRKPRRCDQQQAKRQGVGGILEATQRELLGRRERWTIGCLSWVKEEC